jgi:hypothetical protein
MVSAEHAAPPPERAFPPIAEMALGAMALVIIGGIFIAGHVAGKVPKEVPLGLPIGLLIAAGILLAATLVILTRLQNFAWKPFFQVFQWSLLGYLVIAGMIGYAFVVDGTRGSLLIVVILSLVVFAVAIPTLLAFSVARYQEPTQPAAG